MTEKSVAENAQYGLQVILSQIPKPHNGQAEKNLIDTHFSGYKNKIKKEGKYLYSPLKFYMLGDYDVCYIALINNLKFSHKVFGLDSSDEGLFGSNALAKSNPFQSYSSFVIDGVDGFEKIFEKNCNKKYFVGAINFKLNNGLLIGNGRKFTNAVKNKIKKTIIEYNKNSIDKADFLLTHTFAWFELSLFLFFDNPETLSNLLNSFRNLEFIDVVTDDLNKNSLYKALFKDKDCRRVSLFTDTNTRIGFNHLLIENIDQEKIPEYETEAQKKEREIEWEERKKYIKIFEEKGHEILLKTEIEWHVKPGHYSHLEELVDRSELKKYFKKRKKKLVLGKTDYIFKETENSVMPNFCLLRMIINNSEGEGSNLFKHVRDLKSNVYLDVKTDIENGQSAKPSRGDEVLDLNDEISNFAIKPDTVNDINLKLKSLKISRHVRIKIVKVFLNYNNGIQDPILFPYFLDFTIFIKELIAYIKESHRNFEKETYTVTKIETHLSKRIKVFQEGYNIRFLNGYHFENISNFDLDFNSSIQQLLSGYSSLIHEYSKLFEYKDYAPIVKLNDISTVSNYFAINYPIHHFTSPEFVFSTISKEIFNNLRETIDSYQSLLNTYERKLKDLENYVNESTFNDLIESKAFLIDYFLNDCLRFLTTFNLDKKLFYYWFWTYNLQNSSLYNVTGSFNEYHLEKEMLRFNLVLDFFGIENDFGCPCPELFSLWGLSEERLKLISKKMVNFFNSEMYEMNEVFKDIIEIYFKNYEDYGLLKVDISLNQLKISEINASRRDFMRKILFLLDYKLKFLSSDPLQIVGNGSQEIDRLINRSLHYVYMKNENSFRTMKRSWGSGNLLPQFEKDDSKSYNFIDPTGSVFFTDFDNMNDYFRNNSEYLFWILDFSQKSKKDFVIKQLNNTKIS